jgi:excisionase family DNA binding protein
MEVTLNKLISLKTLAELLCVKESWLKSMIFKRKIPFVKVGKHIRFKEDEIQKWVEDRKIQEDSWN